VFRPNKSRDNPIQYLSCFHELVRRFPTVYCV
jgi:hypothetical protein